MSASLKIKSRLSPKALGIVLAVALAAVIGVWFGTHPRGEDETDKSLRSEVLNISHPRAAPDFELKNSAGQVHRLEELRGNAVVLHFWASWCPPCLEEIPLWLDFAREKRWEGKPLRFVAISLDSRWEDSLKILPDSQLPSNTLSLIDLVQKLPDRFGTYQYPETYLLSPELQIVSKWVGPQNWSSPKISEAIEHVIRASR